MVRLCLLSERGLVFVSLNVFFDLVWVYGDFCLVKWYGIVLDLIVFI